MIEGWAIVTGSGVVVQVIFRPAGASDAEQIVAQRRRAGDKDARVVHLVEEEKDDGR